VIARKPPPPPPMPTVSQRRWLDEQAHSGVARGAGDLERQRVVAYLRREAESCNECGLDGSLVSHLAACIEQLVHLEDA
jgi:hypothetical protein